MRSTRSLALLLLALVVLPSGVLAWLGLRSVDAFEAAELRSLRAQARAEGDLWKARGPALREAVAAAIQTPLDAWAARMASDLPGHSPREIALELRGLRESLAPGLRVRLRLLDAGGHQLVPVPHDAGEAAARARHMSRAALLAHVAREADRAYYGDGGEAGAVAVWEAAAENMSSRNLRVLCEVEAARVRAREGIGAAIRAARDLDARHDEATLVAQGRPAVLLWLVAALGTGDRADDGWSWTPVGPQAVYAKRLARLFEDGTIDAIPLTVEERRRVRSTSFTPLRETTHSTAFHAALPGGATLEARVAHASLLHELARQMQRLHGGGRPVSAPGAIPRWIWIEGFERAGYEPDGSVLGMSFFTKPLALEPTDDVPPMYGRFWDAATDTIELSLPGDTAVRAHVTIEAWLPSLQASRARGQWTLGAIGLLMVLTLTGAFLIHRAVQREREARRIRDDFIANVTHEVRTPLTSVLLHGELLVEEDDDAKRREHAAVLQAQGQRLAALVGDMLDFAALERGTRTLERAPVDLAAACREALAPYRVLAEREGVEVTLEAPEGEVEALADPAALARILGNLVANAWKHGRPSRDGHPGRITVEAVADARGGRIEVRDDGPGIPTAERERIFERFGRGRSSHAREGSGIGLSLSRDLARAMGGDLRVRASDGATVFVLQLPPVPDLGMESA